MASNSTILITITLAYAAWHLQCLFVNWRAARRSGFPIFIIPFNPLNVIWIMGSVALRPVLARCLPPVVYNFLKPTIYGWEFLYRYEVFARLGPSFMLVTPGRNELWVAEPETAHSILTRRNDFFQLDIAKRIMGMFGSNLTSSDGDSWQRQRKIVAPLLNESISNSVWEEASRHASELLTSLVTHDNADAHTQSTHKAETDATMAGVRSVAIKVLGNVAYGFQGSWGEGHNQAPAGYRLAYMDTILTVIENLFPAALMPVTLLTSPIMPQSVQRIGHAVQEFPKHVKQILELERSSERKTKANLLSTLVAASDAERKTSSEHNKSKPWLSEDELTGNLYGFTVAGFDTTANTMAYAIALLAVHPEWQNWIREEVVEVSQTKGLQYEAAYGALKRCLALMFEVLRLYTPINHIPRFSKSDQTVSISPSSTYTVPSQTHIFISAACLHVSPTIWGDDALIFRPSRWLSPDGELVQPPRRSFVPWSAGPRICPGMKMAEVEFVAVMMTVFRSWKVAPVVLAGEDENTASERLDRVIADSNPKLTLQMNRPEDVLLRWEEI